MDQPNLHLELAQTLSEHFSQFPQVTSVAISGSVAAGNQAPGSDIDLYVFTTEGIPLEARQAIVKSRGANRSDLDLHFWDPGDEWIDTPTGIEVDVMYWDHRWIEDRIDQVLFHHQPSMGYSTATWHTIRNAVILFDRTGWLVALQKKSQHPYPQPLQIAIISKNYPILRDVIPSYLHQIEKAVQRGDLVSVNHRLAAFLASYFDIIYALNKVLHPGEKRLLELTPRRCPITPAGMETDLKAIFHLAASPDPALVKALHRLIDQLDLILEAHPDLSQTIFSYR